MLGRWKIHKAQAFRIVAWVHHEMTLVVSPGIPEELEDQEEAKTEPIEDQSSEEVAAWQALCTENIHYCNATNFHGSFAEFEEMRRAGTLTKVQRLSDCGDKRLEYSWLVEPYEPSVAQGLLGRLQAKKAQAPVKPVHATEKESRSKEHPKGQRETWEAERG